MLDELTALVVEPGEGNRVRTRQEGTQRMYINRPDEEIKGIRSKRKFWSQRRQEYIEEAHAYLESYPFEHHPEYRQFLQEEVQGHMGLLFWIAYDIILDTEQTRDCVMDALKSACAGIQHYSSERVEKLEVLPWLKKIVHNKAVDVVKKHDKLLAASLEQMIEEYGTEDSLWLPLWQEQLADQPEIASLQQDACQRLAEIFALLPEDRTHAVRMHFLQEQAHSVTGQALGISAKAVNMRSSRGINALHTAVLKAGLHLSDFYVGNFEGVLTQFLTGSKDSA